MVHVPNPRRLGASLIASLVLVACGQNLTRPAEPERQRQEAPPPRTETATPAAVPAPPSMIAPPPAPAPASNYIAITSSAIRPSVAPPPSTARYAAFEDRPWQRVAEAPVSTFSASVDTGSYANVRRFLNRGALPPRDAVRVEELVNYFGYDYAAPAANAATPFAVDARLVASPWHTERGLLRIAIKGQDLAKQSLPPANLIFLVDVSGSMGPQDRLPLVRAALHLLTDQLRAQDRVALVSYANGTKVVLEATPGDKKDAIHAAIDTLAAGGGTYGEAGIRLAYAQARAGFIAQGINRVLLATDGDLNIGVTNADELKTLVEGERKRGVGLTTLGVGDSNYNEALMKKLADVGDGSYHYLDTLQEAHKVLVNEMTSTLATIAQDLKLQIEFNPALVQEYRLVGYELNNLTREQFNDDKVDAGDIGAGHTVTALYEVIPTGAKGTVDPLRYQQEKSAKPADNRSKELAWLKLRYKPPGRADSKLVEVPITRDDAKTAAWPALDKADADLRFAVAVAAWGQWLRGSTQIGDYGPTQIAALARDARGADRYGHRAEFERLVALSASLKR
jgi:Ca-activated chloride channel family protein